MRKEISLQRKVRESMTNHESEKQRQRINWAGRCQRGYHQ
jgi:hypothetical protein